MSLSSELDHQIQVARKGKSGVIPVAYNRVKDYIDIAKNTLYSIAGETGVGKSTLAVDMFLVNPIMWYLANKNDNIKLSVIYLSMERKLYMMTSRIISRLIYEEQGIEIPPKKILGRNGGYQLTDSEYALVQEYYKRIDEWEKDDVLICQEGSKNSTGISMFLEEFAKRNGKITLKDKEDKSYENILAKPKTYEPTHPNHIVIIITDHIGILTPEDKGAKTKSTIDVFSRVMREARDVYGFSPVIVQQMNRNLSDVHRHKMGELKPKLSDIADSSNTSHDSDVVIILHDPLRHNGEVREAGFDVKRFKDKFHRNFYRSLHIVKNSFEASDVPFPMGFHPIYGMLATLPRGDKITEDIYREVLSGQYFLSNGDSQENIEEQVKKPFKFGQK
jgi:replicative DNA helicase